MMKNNRSSAVATVTMEQIKSGHMIGPPLRNILIIISILVGLLRFTPEQAILF
jgi:hypothetical protein